MKHKLTGALSAFLVLLGALAWTVAAQPAADALNNCNVDDLTVDGEEQAFLRLINDYRARNGIAPLALDSALNRAAAWMATDLSLRSGFAHTDSLGRSPWVRMPDCGVAVPGGENLAAGTNYSSAQAALDAWINSPTHRELMLASDFKVIGIARAFSAGSTYGWYWVTDFGYSGGSAAPAPTPTPPPAPTPVPPQAPAAAAPAPAAPAPAAPPPPTTLSLQEGATLVDWQGGYVHPERVFGSKANWVSMVYVFDQGSQTWLRWGPSLDPQLQTLAELRNGVQYWVVVTRAIDVEVLQ